MEYDQLLEYLSAFGWFNLVLLIIVGLGNAFVASNNLATNFMAMHLDHWCRVPELDHLPAEVQRHLAIPWDAHTGQYSQCMMYDLNWTNGSHGNQSAWATENPFPLSDLSIIPCQYGWNFDGSRTTVVMEWDLVCDKAWIVDLFSPLFVVGLLTGSMVTGNLATKFGRKRTLLLLIGTMMMSGVAASLSVHVVMYLACRCLLAVASIGIIQVGYITVAELTPTKFRDVSGLAYQLFYPLGALFVGGMAFILPQWRYLQLAMALICAPVFIAMIWLLPESPRWLAFTGRKAEAAAVLGRMAARNGVPIPTSVLQEYSVAKVKRTESTRSRSDTKTGSSATTKDLIVNPTVRLFFIIVSFTWSSSIFIYSGVSYNLDGLFDNTSVTMVVCGILEAIFLTIAFLLLRYVGRKFPLFLLYGISTVCSIAAIPALLFGAPSIVVGVIALVCRSVGAGVGMVLYVLSVELFPTTIRNIALGYASAICYAVTVTAPFVAGSLTSYWAPIPFVVFGVMSVINGVLVIWLPETKDMPQPETIAAMEALRSPSPKSLMKHNLVYVAQSSIVEGLAQTTKGIDTETLGVIEEIIRTQRQESLNIMPQAPYFKPVFIVVPEGTGLASVDNFVLQEVEDALQNGEELDQLSYAQHRVYDLDSFRALNKSQNLKKEALHGTTPTSALTQGLEIHDSRPAPVGQLSQLTAGLHSRLNSVIEEVPQPDGFHLSPPYVALDMDVEANDEGAKTVIQGIPQDSSSTDPTSIPQSFDNIAFEMPPSSTSVPHVNDAIPREMQMSGVPVPQYFENIAYEGDPEDALTATNTQTPSTGIPIPRRLTELLSNSHPVGSAPCRQSINIPWHNPRGRSHTHTGDVAGGYHRPVVPVTQDSENLHVRAALADIGLLPTVQPLYQAILDDLEVGDLDPGFFLSRM